MPDDSLRAAWPDRAPPASSVAPTERMRLESFYVAARAGDTRAMAAFFAQPDALASASETESLLNATPVSLPSNARAWNAEAASRLCEQLAASGRQLWFDNPQSVLPLDVVRHSPRETVAWLFGPDAGLRRWLPRTLALLLPFRLRLAIAAGESDLVEELLRSTAFVDGYDDAQRDAVLMTLSRALLSRLELSESVVNVLLAHGASVEDLFVYNEEEEAEEDHTVLLPVVLAHGAWVVGRHDVFRGKPGRARWFYSREPFVRAMLRAGADVRHTESWHDVVRSLDTVAMELLLNEGLVDVDSQDDSSFTPLMAVAATNPHTWPNVHHAVELLVRHGAEADARSADGRTALSVAAGATFDDDGFHYRPRANMAVQTLLTTGRADPNTRDALQGWTPLHHACASMHADRASDFLLDAMTSLVAHGADLHARDFAGHTPLELLTSETDDAPWPRAELRSVLSVLVLARADLRGVDLDVLEEHA